jgi:hypothetical protein
MPPPAAGAAEGVAGVGAPEPGMHGREKAAFDPIAERSDDGDLRIGPGIMADHTALGRHGHATARL